MLFGFSPSLCVVFGHLVLIKFVDVFLKHHSHLKQSISNLSESGSVRPWCQRRFKPLESRGAFQRKANCTLQSESTNVSALCYPSGVKKRPTPTSRLIHMDISYGDGRSLDRRIPIILNAEIVSRIVSRLSRILSFKPITTTLDLNEDPAGEIIEISR